ncbi:MAG: hypothetical protein PHX61_07795 [Alphaproteobacteria bacterium]|nr:hypothetical protein [Alphaproteobacteria bacterium]
MALKLIERNHADKVTDNAERFRLNPAIFYHGLEAALPGFISDAERFLPSTVMDQAKKSPSLILDMISRRQHLPEIGKGLLEYPFLSQATESNTRFGSKLIMKFYEFDKSSKENISFLYHSKEAILQAHPEIDPASNEFRLLMQNNLLDYRQNAQCVRAIAERFLAPEIQEAVLQEHPELKECLEAFERLFEEEAKRQKDTVSLRSDEAFMGPLEDLFAKKHPALAAGLARFKELVRQALDARAEDPGYNEDFLGRKEVAAWLNHDRIDEFTLGEENARFSDKIKTPIGRVEEFMEKYNATISRILSEYRPELERYLVENPEAGETRALMEKLESQLEAARSAGDGRKAAGIEKGLANSRSKLGKLGNIGLWNRIEGSTRRLRLLTDEAFASDAACRKDEEEITALAETKDKAELFRLKKRYAEDKRVLREKFRQLESFVDAFGSALESSLAGPLGAERASALMQEITLEMKEDFIHYDNDKQTLESIFAGEDAKNPLDGTDMRVRIASRDPDLDLYLGNYCPCCICIESEYHREESPISDYVTDLGMQNIIVEDAKRGIPVVSCWCFLGQDDDTSIPVLVVDNIEAKTDYSSGYPVEISDAIRRYIEDYAGKCGIRDIRQGPDNNDLEIFPLGRVSSKVGGYNRPEGYFLEAEFDDSDEE